MIEFTRFMYCPRCGLAELKDISTKAMRCTECGYVYYHNTAAAVGAIVEMHGDGVIVTVRGQEPHSGKYDLPGGFVDYNESLEEAIIREVHEELGMQVTISGYLGSFPNTYTYRRVDYFTCDTFFICRPLQRDASVVLSGEIKSWEAVPRDKLLNIEYAFASHVNALTRYVAQA